jgi:hypothetical protein
MIVAVFVPGIQELIILGVVLAVPVAIAVAVVLALTSRSRADASNPNLTPCPDCHRYVSIHASSCPKCGCPLGGD